MMHPERIYADGPVRAAARIGIPSGLIFGLFQLVATGSALRALVQGASFGVLFGAWLAWDVRRRWRRSSCRNERPGGRRDPDLAGGRAR